MSLKHWRNSAYQALFSEAHLPFIPVQPPIEYRVMQSSVPVHSRAAGSVMAVACF